MQAKKFIVPKGYELMSHDGFPFQLGFGSCGSVRLAKCLKTGETVAVKRVKGKLNQNEVQFHMKLNHPNIIKLYDYSFDEQFKSTYIVLQYAQNGTLFDFIRKNQVNDKRIINGIFHSVCDAVEYMHQKNIMHRDIKPENILLDRKNVVKLCDFGFASNRQQRTTIGGTAQYMAPQILARKPYNYKVDIWALGVLYYQLIEGRAAFQGSTIDDVQKRLFKPLQFSKRFRQQQINLINMILKINPEQRPQIKQIIKSPYLNSNNFVFEVSQRSTTYELTFQQSKIKLISQKNMNDYQQKKIIGGIHIMSVKNLTQLKQTNQLSPLSPQQSIIIAKIDKSDRTNLFLCPKQRISLKRTTKRY